MSKAEQKSLEPKIALNLQIYRHEKHEKLTLLSLHSLFFLPIFLINCQQSAESVPLSTSHQVQSDLVETKQDDRKIFCLFLLDGTGSYNYSEKSRQTVIRAIRSLPGGSKIIIRWITENSASDQNSILSAILPIDPDRPRNPFDKNGMARYKKLKEKKQEACAEIYKLLMKTKFPDAKKTDLWGAIYSASERFKNSRGNMDLKLIILSDLNDNVHREYLKKKIDLSGVDVQVLDFQVDPREDGRKERWAKILKDMGAKSVQFSHIDEITDFNNIILGGKAWK